MKKISTLCLVLLSALASWAYDFKSGDLYYNITSDVAPYTVEVTYDESGSDNYSGLTTATIPASVSYNGITYSVTSIGGSAFDDCDSLTSITIPESVTNIEDGAFKSCDNLTSITIPNSVTSIGDWTFFGCSSLSSVTIGNSVKSIGDYAFASCKSLTSITIPNSVTSTGKGVFISCSSLSSITIGNSVKSIGEETFYECTSLASITIPNSVTSIGERAFYRCTSLISATIGSGVTLIGYVAFWACSSLTSITCKATRPSTLGSSAFPSTLTVAYIPCGTKEAYEASKWGTYSITSFIEEDCPEPIDPTWQITYTSTDGNIVTPNKTDVFGANIVSNTYQDGQGVITFDGPVTSIGEKAFYERKSLASITIPNSVTTIGKWAFSYCTSISSVTIPNSITSIGLNAFSDCGNLTATHYTGDIADWCEIQFGTYDANPVHHSHNLYINGVATTDLVIPASVERIGDYTFQTCTSLKSITISEGVKHIGMSAFAGCQISSITIPESIESIGNFAFHACSSLSSVTLGSGVKSIGSVAFADCTSLTSITIPESVTSIGESAFSGCDKLKTVYVKALTPPTLGDDAFKDAPIAVCHILCGTKAAYEQSDWAKYVTEFVDEGCSSIEQITYTTMNDSVVAFNTASDFGAYYVKNEYKDGKGVIYFNTPITKIGAAAFSSCGSLTSITLPEGVVSIEEGAFNACTQLKSVVIPSTVVSIGNNAFNSCHALSSVVLPKNIKTIGESAFANCQNLMAITLPNGLTSLGGSAFMGCVALQSVELPNTLASIGAQTFLGCSSLRTITIPASIKTIDWLAFSGCRGLSSITCESKTPAELENYAFYDVLKSIPVYIPCASLENYEKAAGWKEFTNLTEPEPEIIELQETACDSYRWDLNGNTYTASTKDSVVLTTAEGCDSIVVLNLTINQSVEAEMTVDTCDTYTWNGQTYTTTGDYTYTTTAQNGCDSTITLHLIIYPSYHVDTAAIACDEFEWYGNTYTASGDYTYTTTTINGCDSIVTLHLTVNKSTIGAPQLDTICFGETFTWNGQDYTATGEYQQTLTNAAGCDSLATLQLLVLPQMITQEEKVAVCPSQLPYSWKGQTLTTTGTYSHRVPFAGTTCDSIEHLLAFEVLPIATSETTEVACDTYTWNGNTYTASGDYTFTTTGANGCDSIATLHLTINHSVKTEETAVACDSYTWNGITYSKSGDYTYTTTAQNGCDSTITLHLTINQSVEAEVAEVACDSYTWNGKTYTTSGDYTFTTTAKNGCDSTTTLHLTINHSVKTEETAEACDSYTWAANGQTYTASGDYTHTLQTIHGCDSTITLHLTINKSVATEQTIEACDNYTWNNITYQRSGDYVQRLTAANGCDSVVTLHLTIHKSVEVVMTETACDSYTWDANGQTYSVSGTYTDTLQTLHGCDSIVVLRLTINKSVETEETAEACDSYTWNGNTYTTSGDYTYTTTSANGCDSTVTLHLTINQSVKKEETAEACDSYTWNGNTYTTSGDYTFTTTAKNGCDSITTLHLTINNSVKTEETVEACDSYTWNGKTYTKSGDYTFTTTAKNGCDSTITLHLTINKSVEVIKRETACDSYYWNNTGKTYDQSGVYYDSLQTIHGCDSVIVLHLTINKSVETEETVVACDSYTWKANGQTYIMSGDYTHTLQTIHGCDSVVTLHLTVNQSVVAEETIKACDSYTWNGKTYTKSGDYIFTTTAKNGCDSTITLHLTINKSIEVAIRETACDSYYWENKGKTYTETGVYYDTLQTIHGCDSIVVLRLTVNHSTAGEEAQTICYGETYKWHGTVYNATGDYTYTLTNSVGCDSVATLHLTVMPKMIIDNQNVAICSSDLPYTWYGKQLTSKGTYTHRVQFANVDCDSVEHILKLDVLPPTEYLPVDKAMICWGETYTWATDGKVYDETGTYTHVIKNFLGCDSLVYTLELTELPAVVNKPVEKQYICWGETYTWHGKTYDETTTDTYVVENMLGCDSIIYTLELTELPAVVNKPVETKYICYGDTYTWHGIKCNVEKTYTYVVKNILDCDSIIYTLDLKVLPPTEYLPADKAMICWGETYTWATDGKVYDKSGSYTHVIKNFLGCDSLVYTLELTELPAVVNKPVEKQYICWGETYTWHGKTYDKTTTDTYVVENMLGCDSIIYTLELTELSEMQTKNESISVCPSELPYTWRGQQLTKSGVYTSYVPFVENTDCDSLEYVLDFVVMEETKSEKTVTACDSYEWNGKVYTTSGRYTYSTTGANGCDSTAILYLTINRSTYSEEYVTVCYGETYEWNGMEYRQEGNYTMYLTNAAGCDSIAILHLTILPQMKHEYEELTLCPSDLPYLWHGQSLTKPGTYTDREQYTHYDCDRVEYHLTLKVYDFSAPAKVTMPRAICGNVVDVIAATEDIEAYIASIPSYAANATIGWQIKKNGTWATLTNEPVKGGVGEITLRYVIYSECGSLPSEEMVVPVEMPTPENDVDMDGISIQSRYNNRIFLFDLNAFNAKFGWKPEPAQVVWYKVVGTVDTYGEKGDDIKVGVGHSYNMPNGAVIEGAYYVLVERMEVTGDECEAAYRSVVISTVVGAQAPKLVPNAVRPSEMMTIKDLDPNQINEIYVYSTTGEMLATYTAEKVREFMLRASNTTGYYIIDVVNNDGKHTLKYIVK